MSLQVWLPLNGDLRNNGVSDLNFTILQTDKISVNDNGKIGKCFNNNSSSSYGIVSDKQILLGQNQSMFCWFKFTSLRSDAGLGGGLVNQHRYSANKGMGLTIRYVTSTTGYLSIETGDGSSRTYNKYCGTTLLQANIWYHGGYTYDGSTIKIYLNGICENTISFSGMSVPSDYITIFCWSLNGTSGNNTSNSFSLNGYLNDIRIYDHTLSEKEVKEISKGLILHYPLNGNGRAGENIVPNTFPNERTYTYPSSGNQDKWTAITSIVPSLSQYVLSFWAKSTVAGDKARAHWYSPNTTTRCESSQGVVTTATDGNIDVTLSTEWKKYWIIYTQSETTAVKHLIFPRLVSGAGTGTISVKQIKLEAGTVPTPWIPNSNDTLYTKMGYNSTTEYDTSGNKYNGTKMGTLSYDIDSARYSTSSIFNGSDNGILIENLPLSNVINTEITYSFWIKPNGENGARSVYFGSYSGTSWSIEKTPGDILRLYWNASPDDLCTGATIADGEWQHICITKKGTSDVKVYINGVQKWSSTAAHNNLTFPTTYRIGRDTRGDATSYKGLMSDFRIYATALSADDVKALYNTAASATNNGNLLAYELVES